MKLWEDKQRLCSVLERTEVLQETYPHFPPDFNVPLVHEHVTEADLQIGVPNRQVIDVLDCFILWQDYGHVLVVVQLERLRGTMFVGNQSSVARGLAGANPKERLLRFAVVVQIFDVYDGVVDYINWTRLNIMR